MEQSTLPTIFSTTLNQHVGQRVSVTGWIQRIRALGALTFVVLRDGPGLVQIVHHAEDGPSPAFEGQTAVRVTGTITIEERAPGGVELRHPEFQLLSAAEPTPVHLGGRELDLHLDSLLNARGLTLRHPTVRRVFRVQNALVRGFRNYLTQEEFTEVHTPKLIAAASEGGANVFRVDYFGQHAYLAQSPQLYKQMLVGAFGRVFEVGSVFRAEPHATTRHLSEYVSLDLEMGFIDNHRTVMKLLESVLGHMLSEAQSELTPGEAVEWPCVPDSIPCIHFFDALELVSRGLGRDAIGEPDLSPAHEAWLGRWAAREYGSDFLFVEGYPQAARPFYTHGDPLRPGYSHSFDLLFRGQEIVTGGQRLHRHADYLHALAERGLSPQGLEDYLEVFRYGMPPHGGLAIGLERLTARLMNLANLREATLFPRDRTRLTP